MLRDFEQGYTMKLCIIVPKGPELYEAKVLSEDIKIGEESNSGDFGMMAECQC